MPITSKYQETAEKWSEKAAALAGQIDQYNEDATDEADRISLDTREWLNLITKTNNPINVQSQDALDNYQVIAIKTIRTFTNALIEKNKLRTNIA